MNINRRIFIKNSSFSLLVLAIGSVASLSGCTAGSVFTNILSWIPTAVSAINGIVTVLGPFMPPGSAAIITLIDAALASLSATITEYNNDTNAADKATLLAKIRTILNDVSTNFQSFLNTLGLGTNPIVAVVIGLANIILSAIAGFLNQIPQSPTTTSISYRLNGMSHTVTPKLYKSVKAFKSDYNAMCVANNHPEIELK